MDTVNILALAFLAKAIAANPYGLVALLINIFIDARNLATRSKQCMAVIKANGDDAAW